MTTKPALDLAGIRLGDPVATVADAIAQDATLAAIIDVATARRTALKAWAGRELGRPGASEDLMGVGKALVTDPTIKPVIVDPAAFRSWALRSAPDRTDTVNRVHAGPIEQALAAGDDQAAALADLLDAIPGAVTTEVVVEERLATDVGKPARVRELDDGRLVDKETGEIIAGLALKLASQPTPRITPDKALVAEIAAQITDRLSPLPALDQETDR